MFERDLEVVAKVRTSRYARFSASSAGGLAENVAENVAERVREIGKALGPGTPPVQLDGSV